MTEPFDCPGCHDGDIPDFDHFCDVLDVTEEETPIAFAAWLGRNYDWNGGFEKVMDCGA